MFFYISMVMLMCAGSASRLREGTIITSSGGQQPYPDPNPGPWEALGKAVIERPGPETNGELSILMQPFHVAVSVELMVGVDYSDWQLCHRVNADTLPYCAFLVIIDGVLHFAPKDDIGPPEYDFLEPTQNHFADAWFESISTGHAWGLVRRHFRVGPLPSRQLFLELKPGRSPSVGGLIIEPRPHPKLEYVIRNVATQLPGVRPIHLIHGLSLDVCAHSTYLCDLVASEELVLHKLVVDDLTFSQYNRLLISRGLWERVGSTDKVLVFQTDTVVCSGRNSTLVADFGHIDYIGSRQRLEYYQGNPPVLVEKVLPGGNGGLSLRDVSLSRACATAEGEEPSSGHPQEDLHFAVCIQASGGRLGTAEEQDSFAAYSFPEAASGSLGAHKLDTRTREATVFIESTCPEYRGLLD